MYDIPATKERHRTLGLARSHPNEAKRTFRYTDDFHSTSTSLLIPTITQTNPSPPHHPITPSSIHPSSTIHHPPPTTHLPIHPSPSNSNSLSSPRPLPLSTQSALSTLNRTCSLFSCLLSCFRTVVNVESRLAW